MYMVVLGRQSYLYIIYAFSGLFFCGQTLLRLALKENDFWTNSFVVHMFVLVLVSAMPDSCQKCGMFLTI